MSRRTLSWIDAAIILAVILVVGGFYVFHAKPGAPTLVVWSCGGNYHSLEAFSREFEQRHDCRVKYTAAPVQYLLEEVAFGGGQPDLMVGRSGPGWDALKRLDKLAEGPDFFAADPYVIITPAGNPAGITGLNDLGKPGVRVAASPRAMRPKGKCPGHLMGMVSSKFFPGLDERWENNFAVDDHCARLLPEPVMEGKADAAVVARSMLAYPGVDREALDVVPIAVKHLNAMKVCRATIGQSVGIVAGAREPELARLFRDEMLGEEGRTVFEDYAYIHITNPKVHDYDPFLETFTPNRMPPWQVHLGNRLAEEGIVREAIRRYMKVIHTFGPNSMEAYCRYRIGTLLAQQGNTAQAAEQWRTLVEEYPREGPHEWGSPVFKLVGEGPKLKLKPPEHYVQQGRKALAELGPDAQRSKDADPLLEAVAIPIRRVIDGDPPKNGTREMALGDDLLSIGIYDYASRDLLKVLHLCYPSRFRAQAGLKLGACDWLRGRPENAKKQWEWTIAKFPDTDAAQRASEALELASDAEPPSAQEATTPCPVEMPPWEPEWDTWGDRGMSYGMALYDHDLPLFTFKEMIKLLHGVYRKHKLGPQARYRAGIAAWSAGHPAAGIVQWRLCADMHPGTPWAERSEKAVQAALNWSELTDRQRAEVEAAASQALPKISMRNKPPCWQRYSMGREFLAAGILEDGQTPMEFMKALTVTRAAKGKYDESVVPLAEEGLRQSL